MDRAVERVWEKLKEVNLTGDGLFLDEEFFMWEKGTSIIDVWDYFHKKHSKGIKYLMSL